MRRGPRIRGCRGLAGLSEEHCSVQATGRIWQDDWGRLTPDGRVSGRMRRRSIASIRWNSCGELYSVLLGGRRANRMWFCRAAIGIRASKQRSFHRYRSSCSWKPENRGSLVFPGDLHANNCSIDDHGIPSRLCERDSEPTGLPAK